MTGTTGTKNDTIFHSILTNGVWNMGFYVCDSGLTGLKVGWKVITVFTTYLSHSPMVGM